MSNGRKISYRKEAILNLIGKKELMIIFKNAQDEHVKHVAASNPIKYFHRSRDNVKFRNRWFDECEDEIFRLLHQRKIMSIIHLNA